MKRTIGPAEAPKQLYMAFFVLLFFHLLSPKFSLISTYFPVSEFKNLQVLLPLTRANFKCKSTEIRLSSFPRDPSLNSGERIETLTSLGLTLNQARAYLSLLQLGPVGAKELAESSKITRQDIYRVMLALEEKGIVEKLILTPTLYRALPVEQVTAKLLDSKVAQQKALQRKTRQLVADVQTNGSDKPNQNEVSEFIMVPGKEAIVQRLSEALSKTNMSLDVVTSRERFSPAILEFAKAYGKALERGVRIRIAAEKHLPQNGALEITRNLTKVKNFEVRFFSCTPEALISIFDAKEASVAISKTANLARASALWSNDSGFVALARNYFENMWNNATQLTE